MIKGVGKDMTNLRYLSADYNTFEDDVLDLTGCQYLFELSLISCSLRELLLNGCTNLGTRQSSRPGKPEQDGTFTIHSNYLRALDLTGVTGELDETAPRNYNYNLTNKYPELLADYIKHNGYNGQITTKVKPDVAYIYYGLNENPKTYTYIVYLRLDGTQSEETEGSFLNSLLEVGPTNYSVDRVKQWVRFIPGQGNVTVVKDDLQLVRGTKARGLKDMPNDFEFDPSQIPGDILSLGVYTVPQGAGEQTVTGRIAYLYNTKQDVDPNDVQVVNPEQPLDDNTKIRDYYVSQTLSGDGTSVNPDGDNLFPFEVEWEVTLSDQPEEIITSISNLNLNKEVAKVTYVNLMGVESDRPFEGVNIVVTRYTDGSETITKVIR